MPQKKTHDIFLSYSRQDLDRVVPLVKALEAKGLYVWWDREIPYGKTFDEVIEENLANSRVVVVVWSKTAVKSNWVREEAYDGLERNILVPVKIENVRPPLGFRMIQTVDLVSWKSQGANRNFDRFLKSIFDLLGRAPKTGVQPKIIQPKPKIIADPNTFTDPRDGQSYKTVKLKDGKIWMAQNLNFDVGRGCLFYENDPKNGKKSGRLYTWKAALRACPPGWRVPSDEEWREMVKHYGGYLGFEEGDGTEAYMALMKGGNSDFYACPGGRRGSGSKFYFLESLAVYWSSTEVQNWKNEAWTYEFSRFTNFLTRMMNHKTWALSCRCIKND